ncbi:unnamed protein product, partial [Medioppia subpectinata]
IECETETTHCFYELDADCRRVANALKDLGLKEGDIFGVLGENSYEYLVLYMAGIIAGAVVYGISSTESFQNVSNKIIQQNIKLIAISYNCISYAERISDGIPITQTIIVFNGGKKTNDKYRLYQDLLDSYQFEPFNDEMIAIPHDPKQTECLILSSSGCVSGCPKSVVYSHHSVVSALEMTSYPQYMGYTQTEVVSSHCEFAHQMSIFQIFTAISTGSKIVLMPRFEIKQFIHYVKKYKISAALLNPSAIVSLVKAPDESADIPSLIKIISCGSVLPKTIAKQFIARYKHVKDLRQALFDTRCMAPITLLAKSAFAYESAGVAFPDTKIMVKALGNGDQLSANQIGEICVHKDFGFCRRYLNIRDAPEGLVDSGGWLHTGDLGYYDEDRHLYAIGSLDEMIKSNNVLIAPSELEIPLLGHSAVSEAAVIAVPDDESGQTAVGFVVLKEEIDVQLMNSFTGDNIMNTINSK